MKRRLFKYSNGISASNPKDYYLKLILKPECTLYKNLVTSTIDPVDILYILNLIFYNRDKIIFKIYNNQRQFMFHVKLF